MAENTNHRVREAGDDLRNAIDGELCEEEVKEQDLHRRNKEGFCMEECTHSGTSKEGANIHDTKHGTIVSERSYNLAKNIRKYFNKKSDKRHEEAKHWEEIGGKDFIKATGKYNTKRLFWEGSLDSQGCPQASFMEVKDIFRHTIMNLGAYEADVNGLTKAIKIHDPMFDPKGVIDFQIPTVPSACPPYFIYVDHKRKEVSMYIRGLNLMHCQDYIALLSNRAGEKDFDGGYVHHGMSGPAEWAMEHAGPVLKNVLVSNKGYELTLVGHSLGAGVAALLTMFLIHNTEVVGGMSPDSIRGIFIAPPRVMSRDLAIKYAPRLNSVIYQDDFLPRVSTQSMKRLFLNTFAFAGAIVFIFWIKQGLQSKVSEDTRRLYPPGKIYHFVYKQPGKHGDGPIQARLVSSSTNRFERLVFSSSTINNHFILELVKHLKTFNWPEELKDEWLTSILQTA